MVYAIETVLFVQNTGASGRCYIIMLATSFSPPSSHHILMAPRSSCSILVTWPPRYSLYTHRTLSVTHLTTTLTSFTCPSLRIPGTSMMSTSYKSLLTRLGHAIAYCALLAVHCKKI